MKRLEIQAKLELKDRQNFVTNYINPAIELGYIEMTEKPTSKLQKYRLTTKGKELKKQLL